MDPRWAWQPWEPSAEQPWDRRAAAHLMRRAGFGASCQQLDEIVALGHSAAIERLVDQSLDANAASQIDRETDQLGEVIVSLGQTERLSGWWLLKMHGTGRPLLEKTTLFWHGHFATSAAKVTEASMMHTQYQLLQSHAFGKFEPLVQRMSRDPAMLIYLDSTQNRKTHPNENYARELLELFCLGPGNYTEADIQELARSFTGWEVLRGQFHFRAYMHDEGEKSILGRRGRFGGEEAVRVILDSPACLRFLAGKLAKYFVADEPRLSEPVIDALAKELRDHDLTIEPVVRTILKSNAFWTSAGRATKIRTPVEFALNWLATLEASTDFMRLAEACESLGQRPFYPPNVKGWDGGRIWIDSSTLIGRSNLLRRMFQGNQTRILEGRGLGALVDKYDLRRGDDFVNWLDENLLAVPLAANVRDSVLQGIGNRSLSESDLARLAVAVGTLPEMHLS